MKTQKFFTGLTLVFVLAFLSCMFATMGWNLLSEGALIIDWETCLALATIIGFSIGFAKIARHIREKSYS